MLGQLEGTKLHGENGLVWCRLVREIVLHQTVALELLPFWCWWLVVDPIGDSLVMFVSRVRTSCRLIPRPGSVEKLHCSNPVTFSSLPSDVGLTRNI